MKKITQSQLILSTLKRRKNGFTDAELAEATGLTYAASIRSKLASQGLVIAVGSTVSKSTNRELTKWGLA